MKQYQFFPIRLSISIILVIAFLASIWVGTAKSSEYFGAWKFQKEDNNCGAHTISKDLKAAYFVFTKSRFGESIKIHWIHSTYLGKLDLEGEVLFKFDTGITHSLIIRRESESDVNDLEFTEMLGGNLLREMKTANSFEVFQGNLRIAGPFSLKGSTKALNSINDC